MSSSAAPRFVPAADIGVNFDDLLKKLDAEFAALRPSVIEHFQFDLDGVAIELRRVKQKTGYRFLITAMLGHLPFSIESAERRQAILAIVAATAVLPDVRFSIDPASRITVGAVLDIADLPAPDSFFYPLTLFLQEARPFMRLIGQYL